jgi:hypothetical protein
MFGKDSPLTKEDIQYDPVKQEVTLKREKFDNLMKLVESLVCEAEASEARRVFASASARQAERETAALQILIDGVQQARVAIQDWLASPGNSIRELSTRANIPYATCHRFVTERLKTSEIGLSHLAKLTKAIESERPYLKRQKARHRGLVSAGKVAAGAPRTKPTT